MKHYIIAIMGALLLAGSALANTWTDCNGNTTGDLGTITKYNLVCMDCTDAAGGDVCIDSRAFSIRSTSAVICFDPDTFGSEGADQATMNLRYCRDGKKPTSSPKNACEKVNSSVITGIEGSPGTQDACTRVGPGAYYIDFVAAATANDKVRVTIQGEGD